MRRSRIGLLCSTAALVIGGTLTPATAMAQETPAPAPPTTPSQMNHHDMLKGVLHGEGLVQTTKGPIRVAMQRGEATKLTQTQLTVVSTDGFSRTWNVDKSLRVYDKRHTLQPNALKAGAQLTVAGTAPAATNGTPAPANGTFTAKWVLVESSGTGQSS